MPRTYADLLALHEATEPWKPPTTDQQADSGDRPTSSDIDQFTERQIAEALEIDVLGKRDRGTQHLPCRT